METDLSDAATHVTLTWVEKQIEQWIRFGPVAADKIIDRRSRIVSFLPNSIFGLVRWASNDYGTIVSRIDIVRTVSRGESYQSVPFVQPGGELLLRINGWAKVERVLQMIDIIETLDIDPADAAPDYWRHLHNRLIAGQEPRPYSIARHEAWLKRRRIGS